MILTYQTTVFLFCCGVFLCFLLLQERTSYEPKIYSRLCLKLLFALFFAAALYFVINRFVIQGIFQFEKVDYYSDPIKWLKRPLRESILAILMQGYVLTIGDIPFVQNIVYPKIAGLTNLPDAPSISQITQYSRVYSNILLLPAAVLFLILIVKNSCVVIPKGRRLLYVLAGIGVPFSIIMYAVLIASAAPYRTLWSLPLAAAFMCFYLIRSWKNKAAFVLSFLALIISARQMQTSAMAFYSEEMQYQEEVRLAADINRRIMEMQPETGKLPVVIVGDYDYLVPNVIETQIDGARNFNRLSQQQNLAGLFFMEHLGWKYDLVDDSKHKMILAEAAAMPAYPASGCVQQISDIVIVKLSDDENPYWLPSKGLSFRRYMRR
jgi:hypothetical protein